MRKALWISALMIVGFSAPAFAGREDFNQIPDSVRSALSTAATNLGYDLSTDAGRKSFGDYLKTQKDALASAQGFDMSTDEGRKAMHEYVKSQVDSIATSQNLDLSSKEGRDALQAYLISSGNYALVRENRGPRGQGGEGRDHAGPPPPRDGEGASTASKAAAASVAQGNMQARPAANGFDGRRR